MAAGVGAAMSGVHLGKKLCRGPFPLCGSHVGILGGIIAKRKILPPSGGSSLRTSWAASSDLLLSAEAPSVNQYAPAAVAGPSMSTIDFPSASWPVTIRRVCSGIGVLLDNVNTFRA